MTSPQSTTMRYECGTTEPLYQGVWTPQANVLCFGCHGLKVREHELPRTVLDPLPSMPQGQGEAACDSCQRRVAVQDKVAHEHTLVRSLRGVLSGDPKRVYMQQTGGMCSAVQVDLPTGGRYLSIAEDDEKDFAWHVCVCDDETGDAAEGTSRSYLTYEQVVAWVRERVQS